MRLEIFIIGLTAFFVYNAYTDGKYTKMLLSFKKYYKMIFYVIFGLGIYVLLKRNPEQGRDLLLYGKNGTKRSVSETKKKYVASSQDWKCGNCKEQLDHTFEIDHKMRLEYGGGNDVQNLIALCRNCHGRKTASENM